MVVLVGYINIILDIILNGMKERTEVHGNTNIRYVSQRRRNTGPDHHTVHYH
jgi:hypothetical protein